MTAIGWSRMTGGGTGARILTAAALIPIVVVVVCWGPAWLVTLLSAAVLVVALLEFLDLGAKQGLKGFRNWVIVTAIGLMLIQYVAGAAWSNGWQLEGWYSPLRSNGGLLLLLGIFVLGCGLIVLWGKHALGDALGAIGISAAALLFVALPFSYVTRMAAISEWGRWPLLFVLVLVWVGDTAAYFVGRQFGRHLMTPQISPKKTWEGAAANLVGSWLVAGAFSLALGRDSLLQLLTAATIANVAGQIGDLVESVYKRSAGVKDSGKLLPGHGGVLDRIDALIFAAPALWWYLVLTASGAHNSIGGM